MTDQNTEGTIKKWQQLVWLGVAISLGVGFLLLISFVSLLVWKVTNIVVNYKGADLGFVFTSISLVTLTLLRLLAILTGAAVVFGGLAVSFFTHATATRIIASTDAAIDSKGTLATHSPGIVAVVVGAIIIISALYSTSKHEYTPPTIETTTISQQSNQKNVGEDKADLDQNAALIPPTVEEIEQRIKNAKKIE